MTVDPDSLAERNSTASRSDLVMQDKESMGEMATTDDAIAAILNNE